MRLYTLSVPTPSIRLRRAYIGGRLEVAPRRDVVRRPDEKQAYFLTHAGKAPLAAGPTRKPAVRAARRSGEGWESRAPQYGLTRKHHVRLT